VAGRLDTRRRQPPVRIGLAAARQQQFEMVRDVEPMARAAGGFGAREARFGNIPVRLVINSNAGPNTAMAQGGTIPIGFTRRKRGYPPVVTLPGE
jgi:hypothetical protein